ncbi:SAM-dependent methyltransferase [Streptomyces sp. SID8379]|uniref:SAM-dependent methyltransferase n=1 Tax=unclassified Streptomyces TaxID=2593676 RepID=UPI0003609D9E|nr:MULTISPECIES: SAM-dependent methyltransferase [unclassified Streptomyces]MYW64210.1 SAM-dependent methyltransferase [Streptomyces sp. SID8379]
MTDAARTDATTGDGPDTDAAARIRDRIDTSRPHPSRVYDALLGGRNHYPVDRAVTLKSLERNPRGYLDVRHNRDFIRRAVLHLTREHGLRQFLDIGTGLPTPPNVHEIARSAAPASRVVYVDHDPVVLAHARALLHGGPEGSTAYLDADLRDPHAILYGARATLDLERPVALGLAAILHFVEAPAAYDIVATLLDALPSGSAVFLTHLTADLNPERLLPGLKATGLNFTLRSREEFLRFFTDNGLEPVEPGVVPVHRWHPDGTWDATVLEPEDVAGQDALEVAARRGIGDVRDEDINIYGAVALKP